MDNVIQIFGSVLHDEPAEVILDKAKNWGMKNCLVLGESDTGEFLFGGNTSELKDILWVISRALWSVQRSENETLGRTE